MQVKAIIATSPTEPMRVGLIERRALTDHDVLIEIEYAGICHSDIHTVRSEWGPAPYPFVSGHEIAGVVREVGPKVTKHQVGDRVGIGCMVDSCRTCDSCEAGDEQFCENGSTMTYTSVDKYGKVTNGGYSTHIVAEEDFVLRLPDTLSSEVAAPLLCAGITLYSPLKRWGAGAGKKVAIVGMGGLGHMGVKIAAAMGAEVTVLSQTLRKADDAKAYGAARCFATSDPATFEQLKGQFDLIINTVSAPLDFAAYLKLLKVGGAMVVVGLPEKPIEMGLGPLVMGRRILAGSLIGGIKETQEMLDFCGQHNLGSEVEVISASDVNEAYDRVVRSDVRYRFVIDASTIASADVACEHAGEPVAAR